MERNYSQLARFWVLARVPALGMACAVALACSMSAQPAQPPAAQAQIAGKNVRVEFDAQMRSRIIARFGGKEMPLGPFATSEALRTATGERNLFHLTSQHIDHVKDNIGAGQRLTITGKAGDLTKTVA